MDLCIGILIGCFYLTCNIIYKCVYMVLIRAPQEEDILEQIDGFVISIYSIGVEEQYLKNWLQGGYEI